MERIQPVRLESLIHVIGPCVVRSTGNRLWTVGEELVLEHWYIQDSIVLD